MDQVVVQRFQETLNCAFMKWFSFASKFDSESEPKRRSLKGFGVKLQSVVDDERLGQSICEPGVLECGISRFEIDFRKHRMPQAVHHGFNGWRGK